MFDDLNSDFNPSEVSNTQQPRYQSNNSSQDKPNNNYGGNSGGGYNNNNNYGNKGNYGNRGNYGGGGGNFQRKEDVAQDPYLPVLIYTESDFPQEIKDRLFTLVNRFIQAKYTVRVNGMDKDFATRVLALGSKNVELYLPWRNFNEFESKHTFNTATSKQLAELNFAGGGWDKIKDSAKSFLASQVRMIFGDRNNSPTMVIITWSKDGANKASEVTRDTGRSGFIIKMAATYGFGVVNIAKESSEASLEKHFRL